MSRLLEVTISPGRPPKGVLFVTGAFAGEAPGTGGLAPERSCVPLVGNRGWLQLGERCP